MNNTESLVICFSPSSYPDHSAQISQIILASGYPQTLDPPPSHPWHFIGPPGGSLHPQQQLRQIQAFLKQRESSVQLARPYLLTFPSSIQILVMAKLPFHSGWKSFCFSPEQPKELCSKMKRRYLKTRNCWQIHSFYVNLLNLCTLQFGVGWCEICQVNIMPKSLVIQVNWLETRLNSLNCSIKT